MNNNLSKQHTLSNLTYESFKQQLLTDLKTFFPANTEFSVESFSHNNKLSLDGLTILEPGSNICPTIYLMPYFEQYEQGMDFSEILQQICEYHKKHCYAENVDTSFFTCLSNVRPRIVYKLINYNKNRELLERIPHFVYLDFAITFYYLAKSDPETIASILIYNNHLDFWNISKDTLLQLAGKNTPKLLPCHCDSITALLTPSLDTLPEVEKQKTLELLGNKTVPMHVLTNSHRYLGACCILYPDVLKDISDNLEDNLILLPSSIHEFILVPASSVPNPGYLRDIVREINLTGVAPEEVLSDSIYLYDKDAKQISLFS